MGSILQALMFKGAQETTTPAPDAVHLLDMKLKTIQGKDTTMKDLMHGKSITIICNVASKWSFSHKSYVELVNVFNEY